jgi:hypothetical protein
METQISKLEQHRQNSLKSADAHFGHMQNQSSTERQRVLRRAQALTYDEALAISLVRFARYSSDFADILADKIEKAPFFPHAPEINDENLLKIALADTDLIFPHDETSAETRANWLIAYLTESDKSRRSSARSALKSWTEEYLNSRNASALSREEPKAIVIGIMVGIIPGVTLGRIKKLQRMIVIIKEETNSRLESEEAGYIAKIVSQAALAVSAKSIEPALTSRQSPEPDFSDWFFGERDMVLYRTNKMEFEHIFAELQDLSIPFGFAESEEENIAVLAISPILNENYCVLHWDIEQFD